MLKVDSYEIFDKDAVVICWCYDPAIEGESFQRDVTFEELTKFCELRGWTLDEYLDTESAISIETNLATIINVREDKAVHPVFAGIINQYKKTA